MYHYMMHLGCQSDILEQTDTSHIDPNPKQPNEEAKFFYKLLGNAK